MRAIAVAAVVLALVAASQSGAAPRADAVTLSLRQYTNANKVRIFVWFGQVASRAAGEDVEVLGRSCQTSFFRQFAATRTLPGGGWEVESVGKEFPPTSVDVNSGTTFRARWRDQLSNTVYYRVPLSWFSVMKLPGRQDWKVTVNPTPIYMTMKGRWVELQRQSGVGKWVRYKRAKLVHKPNFEYSGATNYETVFKIPTKGLRVRAFLPAKSAGPCYLASATKPWRT